MRTALDFGLLAIISIFSASAHAAAVPSGPIVNLTYASYAGTRLSNGVNQFIGMRYAAPPLASRRFRRAEPPLVTRGIQNATVHGPVCQPVNSAGDGALPGTYDEDCLFVDVYAPAREANNCSELLPVMLWNQGGAFVELVNFNYNGTGLVTTGGVVVVSFNYRVGPYGFLATEELAQEGNLNLGLHDQRAAMTWVHNHISAFGGDPEQVTLFGTSVGGGSVILQTVAYGGQPPARDNATWRAGIGEASYLPSVFEVADQEFHYQDLLAATNCSSLACLRNLSSADLQAANNAGPFPGQTQNALFSYGPVIDGSLIPARPLELLQQGRFFKNKPLILGNSRTEGTVFVPQANTTSEVNSFLQAQYPNITNSTLSNLQKLYADTPRTVPGVNVTLAPLFLRAAEIYGDASFFCPTLTFAQNLSSAGVPVHYFIDNITDPVELAAGFIVPHTWELQAVWGPQYSFSSVALPNATSYNPGGVNSGIVPVVQKYWTSFARTGGDPNEFRQSGAPSWALFGEGSGLRLQTNATAMENVRSEWRQRCAFLNTVRAELGQ